MTSGWTACQPHTGAFFNICRALAVSEILRLQAAQRSFALALQISGAQRNLKLPRPPTLERSRRGPVGGAKEWRCGSARLSSRPWPRVADSLWKLLGLLVRWRCPARGPWSFRRWIAADNFWGAAVLKGHASAAVTAHAPSYCPNHCLAVRQEPSSCTVSEFRGALQFKKHSLRLDFSRTITSRTLWQRLSLFFRSDTQL